MTSLNDKIDALTKAVADLAAHQDVTSNDALVAAVAKVQTTVDGLQTEVGADDTAAAAGASTDNAAQASS